jgi:hypothetical protein
VGRFYDKRFDLFTDVNTGSYMLRIKLTKVEDRRRFLLGHSDIEISGHGNTLPCVLEFEDNGVCGCDGNSRLSFAYEYIRFGTGPTCEARRTCLGPLPMGSSSDRSLATVSKSSSTILFKPRYTGSIVRPHSPCQDKSR